MANGPISNRYAQSNQNNLKQTKIESQERGNSSVVSDSKSSASIKREDSDNSSQLLWCVPDHSTSFPGINKSPLSNNVNGAVRYVPEPSLSAPAVPLMSQFNNTIGVTRIPYPPSPDTPHYSPTYSQDGSLGGASAHDYPAVSNDTHVWMPAESQSAYSGSPFLFHDTGYFDPTYAAYVPATLTNQH